MTVTISRTQRRFVLPESELPTHYYNIAADLPVPLPPPLHPGTREPIGPRDLAPLFPMELIRPGGQHRPRDRDPGGGPRGVPDLPADAAPAGDGAREGARHAGPHLLQERGRLAGGLPQAEHGHRPGLLQPRRRASRGWSPRPAPGSGGARWHSPAPCSTSRRRSSWCGSATSRSRIGAASSSRSAPRWSRRRRARRTRGAPSWPRTPTRPAASGSRSARRSRRRRQPRRHEVLARAAS